MSKPPKQKSVPKSQPATLAAPKKEEGPKIPTEIATKNETLKCLIVSKSPLTYFGKDNKETNTKDWRVVYSPERLKKLFDKVDAIVADAAITDPKVRDAKIAEAYKSFTSPIPKVPFQARIEGAVPIEKQEATPAKEESAA